MDGTCGLPGRSDRHAGSTGGFSPASDALPRTNAATVPDSAAHHLVCCSGDSLVGAFSKAGRVRTWSPMGSTGASPRLPQHAHSDGIRHGGSPFLHRSALCCVGRADLCWSHRLEPFVPRPALSNGCAGGRCDRSGLYCDCRTTSAAPVQMARQIFSILVPPGAPMGSPQVMA